MLIQNALTIDVEDYYHVSGFERDIRREDWHTFPSRVAANTRRILSLLEKARVKATFFVLGWVAEREPTLIREIDEAGHEVGSHSYWHRLVYELSPEEFRRDLRRSQNVLQDILGKRVSAYRAPSFSITTRSLWALDILAEEGFSVDSSVFPILHDRYGIPDAPCEPYRHQSGANVVWEFPMTVAQIGGLQLPVSGGGYFRFYPYRLTSSLLHRMDSRGKPFVFYIHPWEIDPQQPRLFAGSRWMRMRHYVNLHSTEDKFQRLLGEFQFARLDEVLAAHVVSLQRPTMITVQSDYSDVLNPDLLEPGSVTA